MKLKKLELFGFKSFYDKTIFEFSEGITAIVGPNGCGKSNIVDAIRWVLGEHAPSYLRSKALEDVIFAGSDAAGPLGMAEVSLTFSNEEGGGPPGYESYAEIQVTRRTFRNGESEFSINRVPCRLKDIAELFLDTGAGARGYAIIEQGRIATIVNAKPDEKRLIVEEAAGVAKFRVRKKEAERKMENTRQNLARVKDILDEVKRQIGSLDRQVRKAEKYKAIKGELRDLDLRVAARKFRELTRLRAAAGADLALLEDSILALRAELSRLEAEIEAGKIRLAEAESGARESGAAHGALKEEIARREEEWKGNVRQAGELRGLIEEAAAKAAAIEGELAELALRLEESREAARSRGEVVETARARFARLAAEAEGAEEEYRRHRELSDRAKYDLMVRVNLHSTALSSAGSYQRTIEDNERKLARLEEQVGGAGAEAEKTEKELEDARALEAAAREQAASAGSSWEEAGQLLEKAAELIDEVVRCRGEAEGRLHASSSRLDTLSRVYEQKDWATSGVRAVLRHFNGSAAEEEKRIYGVIGDLVETDAPYEKAVEAVLGERMQSIVVRDHSEGLSALQYLKESREGRGTFMPVSLRTREDAPAYLGEEGVIAPLNDVVRVSNGCADLVRGLLGGTLLVRDIDCALRLWNRNGVWNTYVTLEGDVVTAEGALVGGSLGDTDAGILSVKREIRDLEKEIAALASEAAGLKVEEEDSRRTRAELEVRREEMFRRREECTDELRRLEQIRAGLETARAQAAERLEELVQEREYHKAELARIRDEYRVSHEAAQLSEQAKGEEEERVGRLIAALEEKRIAAEEARKYCHAAEIELAELAGKDDAERKALEVLSEGLAEKNALAAEWIRRKTDYETRVRALDEAIEEGRTAVEAGAAELSRRQEEIDRLLGEKAEIAARIDSLEGSMKETRRREQEAAERLSDLRLSAQRIENDLANLDVLTYQRYEAHPADLPLPEEGADAEGEGEETAGWETRAADLRERIAAMGDVNLASIEEYREQTERHSFLSGEKEDLEKSLDDLAKAIQRINRTTRERFSDTFAKINDQLKEVFPRLFLGGRAFLVLLDEENLLETGVELVVQLPGKKLLPLSSLSGGEKSLAAACLIFSIFLVKPSPFCLLDEADAALDDANIDRFNSLVREMSGRYQFLLITHNKRTMELADDLYGITMEKPGISKVVSVKFNA